MKSIGYIFLLIFFPFFLYASDERRDDTTAALQRKTPDAIRFADGFVHTAISPIRWKGGDWLKAGGVVVGTALVSLADKPVRRFWQNRGGAVWDGVERAGFHYGKPYAAFAMTGGFYLAGLVCKSEWAKETGLILGVAYLTSGLVQTGMKSIAGRARPATEVGPWRFDPFSSEAAYHSFPSGHIQIALVSAMVLARRVENPVLKVIFYSTAGVTAVGRMYSDSHWLSDLAFGAAISWFCTDAVLKRMGTNKYTHPWKKKQSVVWNFVPSPQGIAIVGKF
ncbi:phosphatase PAP2 family protein [Parapedobacter tibetensis]|uniref:phosphatase PAP2 family protein n=1 Tax=Parapedobacter tibetensis TaxID=2972951 RepID=UPI00214D6B71|nr:phosphatase PAP2 family protein [Parapedobacter tibetensis]